MNSPHWKLRRWKEIIDGGNETDNQHAASTNLQWREQRNDPVETTTESVSLLLRVVPKVLQLCMTAAGARGLQTVISIQVQPTEDLLTY